MNSEYILIVAVALVEYIYCQECEHAVSAKTIVPKQKVCMSIHCNFKINHYVSRWEMAYTGNVFLIYTQTGAKGKKRYVLNDPNKYFDYKTYYDYNKICINSMTDELLEMQYMVYYVTENENRTIVQIYKDKYCYRLMDPRKENCEKDFPPDNSLNNITDLIFQPQEPRPNQSFCITLDYTIKRDYFINRIGFQQWHPKKPIHIYRYERKNVSAVGAIDFNRSEYRSRMSLKDDLINVVCFDKVFSNMSNASFYWCIYFQNEHDQKKSSFTCSKSFYIYTNFTTTTIAEKDENGYDSTTSTYYFNGYTFTGTGQVVTKTPVVPGPKDTTTGTDDTNDTPAVSKGSLPRKVIFLLIIVILYYELVIL